MDSMLATPSLVRGTKSSTHLLSDEEIDICNDWMADLAAYDRQQRGDEPQGMLDNANYPAPFQEYRADEAGSGQYLTLTCEAWRAIEKTDEGALFTPLNPDKAVFKAVATTDTRGKCPPPVQSGDRWTERLSDKAKKKIEHAALYMNKIGKGFRTFVTLTMTPEWRAQIEKWDQEPRGAKGRNTIGGLVTEFLNVLQQRNRNGLSFQEHFRRAGKQKRGGHYEATGALFKGKVQSWDESATWTPITWREAFKIPAHHQPFQYVWVVENPESEKGEKNPHVHILMNCHVKLDQFHAWSQWIEKTWGKGFANLQRIKKPSAAAHYMAKAAHYISKGASSNQGEVRGNRYSISKDAHAPKARIIGIFNASWIREAIKVGVEAGSKCWPKDTWFHRHGFGANTSTAWAKLWNVLKQDGFKLEPAPPSLRMARFRNLVSDWLAARIDPMMKATSGLFRNYSEFGEYGPELRLSEAEEAWGDWWG